MSDRLPRLRRAIGAVGLALCLTGCQQLKGTAAKLALRKPDVPGSRVEREQTPSARLNSRQKADVKVAIARSLERQGKTDQAIRLYLDVVREDDSRADVYHRLAVLSDKTGKSKGGEEFYRAALERDPENAELHCDYGYSKYLRGRFSEAEPSLRRAIALNPSLARAHNNLGLLLGRTGRGEEALEEFARAGCTEAEARANLGFALILEERWDEARGQFGLAMYLDPSSRTARDGLDALSAVVARSERNDWVIRGGASGNTYAPMSGDRRAYPYSIARQPARSTPQ
jgi:Tfp pilus assembly protein PilF